MSKGPTTIVRLLNPANTLSHDLLSYGVVVKNRGYTNMSAKGSQIKVCDLLGATCQLKGC